jgi:integrase
MAYLYRKARSPYWYVVFFDAAGKERHRSTGFRANDPNETSRAKALRAELEAKERRREPGGAAEAWDAWVPQFLERHCQSEKTHKRYAVAWKWLGLWLQRERIASPRQLTYKRGVEYLDWRTAFKKRTGSVVGRNTAILELKTLSLVMAEAVRLGYAEANPLANLRVHKDPAARKPEITDEELGKLRHALGDEPEWMQVAFAILLHTGCRVREPESHSIVWILERESSRSQPPRAANTGPSRFPCRLR